ncbi:UxaA family hydrolase [Thioclava sp. A2]|uniref:UxaA family hydrolase n=1 Tax=Thioclava sp. FCG-A2 TaxID=3080562 RepID=UPI002954AB5E|nr:UxaA family hydrolase [Thioclava sp. A2]
MRPEGSKPLAGMLLRLTQADNVLVATGPAGPGIVAINGGGEIVLSESVTLGHKVAAQDIPAGAKILKYGVSIGSATQDIPAGAHVHVHNLRSDYTPTNILEETAKGAGNA